MAYAASRAKARTLRSSIVLGSLVSHRIFPEYYGRGIVIEVDPLHVLVHWQGLEYINPRWECIDDVQKLGG
jgi:heat shock protein HspQ